MAMPPASAAAVCPTCGEPLNASGNCVACLLRTALDESAIEAKSDALFVFGDFEIVRHEDGSCCELGRGAMGVTYLARDNVLRRKVALKVIDVPAAARGSQAVRERFLREARAAAALRHPNVAAVFQFGASPDGSRCYYAMELVEGETLETRVRRDGPLNAKLALQIAIQITRALIAAAAQGLIHRDLKPGNIMLTRGDADTAEVEVKVIDFGLAKAVADAGGEMDLTHGEFVGTPNFASPEQFESGPVDVRSDIYSLGATLWFALTGKTPFAGPSIEEIRSAQKSNALPVEQLKAARIPPSVRLLLESMLAFEPAARPGVKDLAAELRRCAALAEIETAVDEKKEIHLEIAHVLFIDIVGYSKLSINEQHAAVDELTQIVRSTEQFQKAEAADRLIKIPSGDGMALVFYASPEASVRCAIQISRGLKDHPRLHIRMGIHSGPVRGVVDVTGRTNLAGAGLNLAQRTMKCGDAGHILLSKHVAEDLSEFEEWRPLLHDLGTCEVKHGVQVAVVNLWSDDVGNRQLPQKFEALRKRRARVRWVQVAVAVLLLAGVVAAFVFVSKKSGRSTVPEKSIAVLTFENASNESNSEYLSEGISEALINSLSELQQLRVIARPTVFRYKPKDVDPRQVGRELGVAVVLTGRVRQVQDALNVQVDLVDAATGAQIWGAAYDRKIGDLVAIKQAIAQEVAAKLKLKLSSEEQRRLVKHDSTNAEAYQFYLRGRYFWNKRTSDGIKQAIEHFQQSIERDPNFALGYVGLADSYIAVTFYNFAAPHETMPKAKELAIKAVALDNTLAEAHASLAHVLMNYDWNWSTAEKEFKRSIELKPDYATAHEWYAIHYLTATGRLEEALQEMKRALELEPASLVMNTFMGATLYYAGQYDKAIEQCRRTVEMDPNFAVAHWHLGLAYEQKQAFDAAIEEFQTAISLSQGSPLMRAALGHAYAKSHRADEANKILDELNELSKQQYVSPLELALIYVALGNDDRAFQFLEKAYAEHSFHLVNLNVSPQFKSVRSDPRFQNLVQRLGLSGSASNPVRPERSIAVLPFENLSEDKANAYFAEGIQDEILTRLSKIADLKVISRTSTQRYKSAPENLPEIAKQLGVAHILEGRVQKSGDAVRVNVQLIKAANDSHLWADTFDRKLTDIFSVESEVAKAIADQLRAKLTGEEEQVIAVKPTNNPEAYDSYLRGLAFEARGFFDFDLQMKATGFYQRAVQLDPNFALAWARLSRADALLSFELVDDSAARRDTAKKALVNAQKLQPNSPETLLALGYYQYWGLRDYGLAKTTLKEVGKLLPGNSEVLGTLGLIARREGNWDESITYFEQALVLDPRNVELLNNAADTYGMLRQFPTALKLYERALDIVPNNPELMAFKAVIYQAQGNLEGAAKALSEVNAQTPSMIAFIAKINQLRLERNFGEGLRLLQARLEGLEVHSDSAFEQRQRPFTQLLLANMQRLAGDAAEAKTNAEQARKTLEQLYKNERDNSLFAAGLSSANAELGDKNSALKEAERAIMLSPSSKDRVGGPGLEENLALIQTTVGENDRAISTLTRLLQISYGGWVYGTTPVTPALLSLDPFWDPLRGDPRFEQIVSSVAPSGH